MADRPTQNPDHVIETASGTTSSDNVHSGPLAYVIAGIAVAVLLGCGLMMRGCMTFAGDVVAQTLPEDDDWLEPNDWDDEQPVDDYDDLIEDLMNEDDQGQDLGLGDVSSVEEYVGLDLAMYSHTVDSQLAASDYGNSQRDVNDFVRGLVIIDRDASLALSQALRAGSWEETDMDDALASASELAASTLEELRQATLPETSGENAKAISRSLKKGKAKTIERWEAIQDELEALSADGDFDVSSLEALERSVSEATDEAAQNFSSALITSSKR